MRMKYALTELNAEAESQVVYCRQRATQRPLSEYEV